MRNSKKKHPPVGWDYIVEHRRRKNWKKLVSVLSLFVVVGTIGALTLPAITMNSPICNLEEHHHGMECYSEKQVLLCTTESLGVHQHTESCKDSEGKLVCHYADFVIHEHEGICYDEGGILLCTLPEIKEHTHNENCWQNGEDVLVDPGHQHTSECYAPEERQLLCTEEESDEHQHGDSCYKAIFNEELICGEEEREPVTEPGEKILVCNKAEVIAHTHTNGTSADNCYIDSVPQQWYCDRLEIDRHLHTEDCLSTERILTCDLPEHSHNEQCQSDLEADVETMEQWEASLPTPEQLNGDWEHDLVMIAQSQVGYQESGKNYQVQEDGSHNGYTRYGAWRGTPYDEWNGMFVEFCLYYAGVPTKQSFYSDDFVKWISMLEDADRYHGESEYIPIEGDIAFLDADSDGIVDRVGIVDSVIADEQSCTIGVIEGDSEKQVARNEYHRASAIIHGFGSMPGQEDVDNSLEAILYRDEACTEEITDSPFHIMLSGDLPEEAIVRARPVELELDGLQIIAAFDITIMSDGQPLQPYDPVQVTFASDTPIEIPEGMEQGVYYVAGAEELERMESTTGENSITFTAQHFSVYAWVQADANAVSSSSDLRTQVNAGTQYIQLAADINISPLWEAMTVPTGSSVTIDLNGHRLGGRSDGESTTPLFTIPEGATLTIIDSAAGQGESTGEIVENLGTVTGAAGAHPATTVKNADGSVTLTYYTTQAVPTGDAEGHTIETLYKHTVTSKGLIDCSVNTYPRFSVTGGTLNIGSGMIYGGANQAIEQSGGNVNISGGYLCGFEQTVAHDTQYYGGAVRTTGGTLNISDKAVLAGNKAPTGGAVAILGGTLNMSGGVISGNVATQDVGTSENNKDYGGGGIFAKNATVNMSAGYLTNNEAVCQGYFNGGGGILISENTTLTVSGGYITSNEAASSGGGIRTNFWMSGQNVYLKGGYICSNLANGAEGGGVCIDNGGYCNVSSSSGTPIYINQNQTNTSNHWGGGGLFGANGATIEMTNVLVTDNSAGGFGGGIAGCSTGRVAIDVYDGACIYGNAASGTNMSGSASTKPDDWAYAQQNEIFMKYGYADYYCALASQVSGGSLGGGSANWSGSCDGEAVSNVGPGQKLTASYIMGLTAHPSTGDIAKAQQHAQVYVNDNHSNTHGGGILANGYLVIGDVINMEIGDNLALSADKLYMDQDGGKLDVVEKAFSFAVTDERGAVVACGTTEAGGNVHFDRRLAFEKDGHYIFHIREEASDDPAIAIDTSEYVLEVDVDKVVSHITSTVTKTFYNIVHIKLTKVNQDGSAVVFDKDVNSSEDHAYDFKIPSPAFTNIRKDDATITVKKVWEGASQTSATVELLQTAKSADGASTTTVKETVTLSAANDWSHTWKNLPISGENGVQYSYEVKETAILGYVTSYSYSNTAVASEYWVPADKLEVGGRYIIVKGDGGYVLSETADHKNAQFTQADKAAIQRSSGSLEIHGETYSTWYTSDQVTDSMIFTAQTETSFNNTRLVLKNGAMDSWLLVEGGANGYAGLKGCNTKTYASGFRIQDGHLQGQQQWNPGNGWHNLVYGENSGWRFNAGGDADHVRLYTAVSGPISQSTTVTITNSKDDHVLYQMDITKQDAEDANIRLSGAEFQVLGTDGKLLSFTGGNGIYAYSSGTEGADTTVITVTQGKLRLTNLPAGTYILREIKAPNGYVLAADTSVTLGGGTDTTVKITVEDARVGPVVLPETGGIGTFPYILSGLALMGAALLIYRSKSRKRKEASR